jgi:RND family efflux transporter MFP subunit
MPKNVNYKKALLPILIVIMTLLIIFVIVKNPPLSKRAAPSKAPQMTVATLKLMPQTYQVTIESFGTVKPRTQSVLFAQVSGQINSVSQQFRAGGFFEQGDILVQLDDRDHRAEVKIAQAGLMSAKQNLQEESARVKQAETDWKRLGNGKKPNALVLRQPQFEAAQAQVLSAEAQLDKAKLSLERTKIIAPYAGRILKKHVDIGQVISSNTQLADIFATDYVEIRLPIKNKDLALMNLPEEYRHNNRQVESHNEEMINNVVISSDLMGKQIWQGKIVRTESAIDDMSQQLYVVAQVIRPYDEGDNVGAQIKIGQYVTAEITGKQINNAIVIPSSAIYQGSYVYVVENGLLMRKDIKLGWQNGSESIVIAGLKPGEQLVLTSLGQVSSGTPVSVERQAPTHENTKLPANNASKVQRDNLTQIAHTQGITVAALIEKRQGKPNEKAESTTIVEVND